MNIKRFIARNNQEALRMVKKEMGSEAVILRTRTIHLPKTKAGSDTKRIEVTAAVDYDAPAFEPMGAYDGDGLAMNEGWRHLEKEIKEIKEALFCIQEKDIRMPDIYFDQELKGRLMNYKSFGLNSQIIQRLLMEGFENKQKQGNPTTSLLQESLNRVLSKIQIEKAAHVQRDRKICSFIGPTGVGKTTTMAKLAAVSALQQGEKTLLITLDTFRIAAVSQLQTYARIMGIPLEVAASSKELKTAIQKHSDCGRVFIDTAGRSPNQDQDIHELKKIFTISDEVHAYLVLSATSGYQNLLHMDKRFNALPIRSYIFTKLDETGDASSMVNFLVSQQKPVSYFSVGQQVPEDIEIASKKKIASMLLSELRENLKNSVHRNNGYGPSNRPSGDSQKESKAIPRH
jgi:flagellar biosynthesis protein FlhF